MKIKIYFCLLILVSAIQYSNAQIKATLLLVNSSGFESGYAEQDFYDALANKLIEKGYPVFKYEEVSTQFSNAELNQIKGVSSERVVADKIKAHFVLSISTSSVIRSSGSHIDTNIDIKDVCRGVTDFSKSATSGRYNTRDTKILIEKLLYILDKKQKIFTYINTAFKTRKENGTLSQNCFDYTPIYQSIVSSNNKAEIPETISDVDQNIPKTNYSNGNRFALIIGNEDYSSVSRGIGDENNVPFARKDAKIFATYCSKILGIEEKKIFLYEDATAGEMEYGINKIIDITSSPKYEGKAEIIFYYAGHGLPDFKTKEPFIIPTDIPFGKPKSGFSLDSIYSKLVRVNPKLVTCYIDACFSGGARTKVDAGEYLRGVKIKPKSGELSGNIVVLAATSSDQAAISYKEKGHGLFTYFLLKKLQESQGNISYKDLFEYIRNEATEESILIEDRKQEPSLNYSEELEDTFLLLNVNN